MVLVIAKEGGRWREGPLTEEEELELYRLATYKPGATFLHGARPPAGAKPPSPPAEPTPPEEK
jgi:hypothetical protein